MLKADRKEKIIGKHMTHDKDTGSPEVQVALLSERINDLSVHFKDHKARPSFKARSAADGRTQKASSRLP